MGAERQPQTKVYPIPVSNEKIALFGLLGVLETPELVVDDVYLSPRAGRSAVGIALTRDEREKGIKKYRTYINETQLDSIGRRLVAITAENPEAEFARAKAIWEQATQALQEAKERQKK